MTKLSNKPREGAAKKEKKMLNFLDQNYELLFIGFLCLIVFGILCMACLTTIEYLLQTTETISATVVDKSYTAENTSVGFGVGIGSNGTSIPINTVSFTPNKFVLFVDTPYGVLKQKTSIDNFAKTKIGDTITITIVHGYLTNIVEALPQEQHNGL